MGIIRGTFLTLDDETFNSLYSVWSPFKLKYIDTPENIQRRATRQLPGMRDLSYPDRLKRQKLPTLVFRRVRGDMIQCYKILHGICDPLPSLILRLHRDCLTGGSQRTRSETIFKQGKYKVTQTLFSTQSGKRYGRVCQMKSFSPPIWTYLRIGWTIIGPINDQDIVCNYRATISGN